MLVLLACSACPPRAHGAQHVTITARFSPNALGAATSMHLGMTVSAGAGQIPSPLTGIDFHSPRSLNIAMSDLGTATCRPATLEQYGPAACPPNSIMGSGTALARFRVGPEIFNEPAGIGVVAGPSQGGKLSLLISATGLSPVAARVIMPSTLSNRHLHVVVPLVPSLPEGEDVAVVSVQIVLGGNLTYYERRHGRRVAYMPKGVGLPGRCPRGGFRFSGQFAFADGTTANASTIVHCRRRGPAIRAEGATARATTAGPKAAGRPPTASG